jgi:hypothetical protein
MNSALWIAIAATLAVVIAHVFLFWWFLMRKRKDDDREP